MIKVGGNARNEVKYSLMDWNCEILVTFWAFWDNKRVNRVEIDPKTEKVTIS